MISCHMKYSNVGNKYIGHDLNQILQVARLVDDLKRQNHDEGNQITRT